MSMMTELLFDDFLDVFDDGFGGAWFDAPGFKNIEKKLYGRRAKHMMCTDIKELDGAYEMDIDLPGFRKDEVKIKLENGYLTVMAKKCNEPYEGEAMEKPEDKKTWDKMPENKATWERKPDEMPENKATWERKPEEMKKECKYICRERCCGETVRSFYIGDAVKQEDIKARFEHGLLTLNFPKKEQKKLECKNYIKIEG